VGCAGKVQRCDLRVERGFLCLEYPQTGRGIAIFSVLGNMEMGMVTDGCQRGTSLQHITAQHSATLRLNASDNAHLAAPLRCDARAKVTVNEIDGGNFGGSPLTPVLVQDAVRQEARLDQHSVLKASVRGTCERKTADQLHHER
jgi:hypothetical protein